MFFWVVLLVFFVSLVVFILSSRKAEQARIKRLDEIQQRMKEKEIKKIAEKKEPVEKKVEEVS